MMKASCLPNVKKYFSPLGLFCDTFSWSRGKKWLDFPQWRVLISCEGVRTEESSSHGYKSPIITQTHPPVEITVSMLTVLHKLLLFRRHLNKIKWNKALTTTTTIGNVKNKQLQSVPEASGFLQWLRVHLGFVTIDGSTCPTKGQHIYTRSLKRRWY